MSRTAILLLCFFIELASISFLRKSFGAHGSALLFLISSLAIGFVGLQAARQVAPTAPLSGKRNLGPAMVYLLLAIGILALITGLIRQHPVDVAESDIIPQTQALVQRQLAGNFPYQPIPLPGYELYPTYQPLQWLPYSIAEWLHFDYRLQAVGTLLLISFLFLLAQAGQKAEGNWLLAALLLLPVLVLYLFSKTILIRTLECGIAAYYLLLCWALWRRSVVLVGLGLVCCLLSRYSVIFFAPFFIACVLISRQKKYALQLVEICVLGFLLIYFFPYFSRDTSIFLKGYQYHSQAALAEWKGQFWQAPGDKPVQLFRGMGMAGLFYDLVPGTVAHRLNVLKTVHLALSCLSVVALGVYYYRKSRDLYLNVFALASLKIYLSIFYHFIQIPYDYLFLTLIYVSVPLIWVCHNRRHQSSFQV